MSESSKIDEIIKKYTITNDDTKLTGDILSRWEAFSGRESGVPTRLDMDSYFDVEGVMTPYVRVWFRGLNNKWIEVGGEEEENYYSQNNFFESMTIEDTGFLSLTLNLIDRTSYRIQSLLELACYNQSKNADENIKNSQETKGFLKAAAKEEGEEGLSLSLFKEKNISNNNLKIRFGYSDVTNINNGDDAKKFFEAVGRKSDANSRWVENSSPYVSTEITTNGTKRTVAIGTANFTHNTQTQPKSYEEEFYIIGFSTQISTTGIKYSIKAIRAANLFLNSYKLVQNYSKLVGTPREIMAYFMRTFNEREDTNLKVYWSGGKEGAEVENFTRKRVANGIIIEQEMKDGETEEDAKTEDSEEIKKNNENLSFLKSVCKRLGFLQGLFSEGVDSSIMRENLIGSNNFYEDLSEGLTLKAENADKIYEMLNKESVDEILVNDAKSKTGAKTTGVKTTGERIVGPDGVPKKETAMKVIQFKAPIPQALIPMNFKETKNSKDTYKSLISYTKNSNNVDGFINNIKSEKDSLTKTLEIVYDSIKKDYGDMILFSNEFKSSNDSGLDWYKKNYNFISLWLFELCAKCKDDLDNYKQADYKNEWKEVIKLIIKTIACVNKADTDNVEEKNKMFQELQEIEKEAIKIAENLNKKINSLNSSINTQNKLLGQETKQIEIILGSERAETDDGNQKQLYKSISSIFSSYTSQAPCHYEAGNKEEITVKDADGNDRVLTKEESAVPRKMSWACLTNGEEDEASEAVVIFYYNSPLKFEKIRKYCWGTGNPNHHCIKDLSVSSSTEFATVLAKTAYATGDNLIVKDRNDNKITAEVTDTNGIYRTVIQSEDDLIERAKENIYKGSMTILGDPSFRFCERVQPYTLPIYIDVKLQSEQSWYYKNKDVKGTNDIKLNQESIISGYYLVSKITHQIDKSGFYTTLEITKYPGLENEV